MDPRGRGPETEAAAAGEAQGARSRSTARASAARTSWARLTGDQPRTLALWFRTRSGADSNWAGHGGIGGISTLGSFGGRVGFLGFSANVTVDGAPFRDGAWHHAAFTYDRATVRLYLDGSPRAEQALALTTAAGPFVLGASPLGGFGFTGALDDAVTPSELRGMGSL